MMEELTDQEYAALGVMPMSGFDAEYRAHLNECCESASPPPSRLRAWWGSQPSRAHFEWHIRRGRDVRKRRESISPALRRRIIARDGMVCQLCGLPVESASDIHVDHIRPHSLGGRAVMGNLQVAHAICNIRKSNKPESVTRNAVCR